MTLNGRFWIDMDVGIHWMVPPRNKAEQYSREVLETRLQAQADVLARVLEERAQEVLDAWYREREREREREPLGEAGLVPGVFIIP